MGRYCNNEANGLCPLYEYHTGIVSGTILNTVFFFVNFWLRTISNESQRQVNFASNLVNIFLLSFIRLLLLSSLL